MGKRLITKEQAHDTSKCPICKSEDIDEEYISCLCHRTYEGSGRTCWTAPICNSCGFSGDGNSDGGMWASFNSTIVDGKYEIYVSD